MTNQDDSFVFQQINFYKRSIKKLNISVDIMSKVENELNSLGSQLDSVFKTNKSKLLETTKELGDLRVKFNKISRDFNRSDKKYQDISKKFELIEQTTQQKVSELNNLVETLQVENREYKRKFTSFETELQKNELLLANKENNLKQTTEDLQKSNENLISFKKRLQEIEKENKTLSITKEQLENSLTSNQKELLSLGEVNKNLEKQMNELSNDFQNTNQKMQLASSHEKLLRQSKNELEQLNSELKKQLERLQQEYATSEHRVRNLENEINRLRIDVDNSKNEQASTRMGLAFAKKELDELKESLNEKSAGERLNEKEIKHFQELIVRYQDLKEKLSFFENTNHQLQQTLQSKESKLAQYEKTINISEKEIIQLKNKLENFRNGKLKAEKDNSDEILVSNLKRKIGNLNSNQIKLEQKLIEKEQIIGKQHQEISLQKTEIIRLQESDSKLSKLEEIVIQKENRIQDLKKQIDELELSKSSLETQLSRLDQQYIELESLFKEKSTELLDLKNSVQKVRNLDYENLKAELETKNKQLEDIEDKFARVSMLYTDLSQESESGDTSLAIFNVYSTLVEKLYNGKAHVRILFLLHSKNVWTKEEISKATGITSLATLRAIHELSRAHIVEWDENNETVSLYEKFL